MGRDDHVDDMGLIESLAGEALIHYRFDTD